MAIISIVNSLPNGRAIEVFYNPNHTAEGTRTTAIKLFDEFLASELKCLEGKEPCALRLCLQLTRDLADPTPDERQH